ncbi:hypothetical protein CTI16_11110 [Prevotella intermedia]|uniref:KAP NTPase domain-containing protein n=1 Tax=Prevotella intermedia TaxID=28131 RepID=A0AAJ3RHX3_PREIN|nr:hypothetical protein [Prevotella intermedia]PIK17524.1 hypothetical protein CTI16_11110 [Prevotella intermedia]
MEYIDITEKLEEFYRHLNEKKFNRTIFSAKFGGGKTEFLHRFKEKYSDKYTFYTLYPVNYQIAPNEQIMEYIKRDLLFQLIKNNTLTPIANISKSVLLQWYLNENPLDIMKSITKCAFTILGKGKLFNDVVERTIELLKDIDNECKDFKKFEEGIKKGDFEKATEIIGNLSEGAGNIYELDSISYLIAKSIINQDKKSVLIIEDLDRIYPAHLFRILNIFSAHIDREYLCSEKKIFKAGEEIEFDTLPNKFGFDKIIFVMDAVTTREIFTKFYGNANYEGYISKFFSKYIFEYSITDYAHNLLYDHIAKNYGIDYHMLCEILAPVDCKIFEKSVRDIAKILNDFEDDFIKEKIKITDDFCFLSDTPFIRLLSIFRGLGIKKKDMMKIFHRIKIVYGETNNSLSLLKLLGCFVMNKESIAKGGKIYYDGVVYKMSFNKGQDGYRTMKSIKLLGDSEYAQKEGIRNLHINNIFKMALKYVN